LEAAKGQKTLNELASEHGVHPNQISTWKRQLLDGGPGLFGHNGAHAQDEQEALQTELFEQIGRLKLDDIFVERFWRSVKYEDIYLKDYLTVPALEAGLGSYFRFYNHERPHQRLDYRTPVEVHFA
jgi:putative transposase